jgi:hypothetical protein
MTNSKLEFNGSPQEVTVREALNYTFNVTNWLGSGEIVTGGSARLINASTGTEVADVISNLSVVGNSILLTIDWRVVTLVRDATYRIWVKATIGTQFKEGFADFKTFYQ